MTTSALNSLIIETYLTGEFKYACLCDGADIQKLVILGGMPMMSSTFVTIMLSHLTQRNFTGRQSDLLSAQIETVWRQINIPGEYRDSDDDRLSMVLSKITELWSTLFENDPATYDDILALIDTMEARMLKCIDNPIMMPLLAFSFDDIYQGKVDAEADW